MKTSAEEIERLCRAKLLKDVSEELKLWMESLAWAEDRYRVKRLITRINMLRSTLSPKGGHSL